MDKAIVQAVKRFYVDKAAGQERDSYKLSPCEERLAQAVHACAVQFKMAWGAMPTKSDMDDILWSAWQSLDLREKQMVAPKLGLICKGTYFTKAQ